MSLPVKLEQRLQMAQRNFGNVFAGNKERLNLKQFDAKQNKKGENYII